MRLEPFRVVDILKLLGIIAGLYLLRVFVTERYPLESLKYQLSLFDPLYLAFGVFALAVLFVPTFVRLYRERRIWLVLSEPFEPVENPFIDIDLTQEMYGAVQLSPDTAIKHIATHVNRRGITVRKAAYPKFFPTFVIPWSAIINVYFVAGGTNPVQGKDPIGVARITLSFSEETILIIPWRKRFNAFVPENIGLQLEDVSA